MGTLKLGDLGGTGHIPSRADVRRLSVIVGNLGTGTFDIGSNPSPSANSISRMAPLAARPASSLPPLTYQMENGTASAKLAGNVGLTKSTAGTSPSAAAIPTAAIPRSPTAGSWYNGTNSGAELTPCRAAPASAARQHHRRSVTTAEQLDCFTATAGTIGTLNLIAQNKVTLNGALQIDVSGAGNGLTDLLDVTGNLDITNGTVSFNALML